MPRLFIYSLRSKDSEYAELSIDLGLNVINETREAFQLQLPTGTETIKKFEYLNKSKVFDNGKVFFLVCTKSVNREYAFDILLDYAVKKIDTRISHLEALKNNYKSQLRQLKKVA